MGDVDGKFTSHTFNFKINSFEKLGLSSQESSKPHARSGHRAVADDDHVWIIGGYNSSALEQENEAYPLFREFWKFNLSSNEWNLIQPDENMPHELASHSAAKQNNHMLVFGGTGVPFGEKSSDQLTACDLNTGRWKLIEGTGAKPEKIYGQAMAFVGSYLYVYGGTTGFVYNTELHRLNLDDFTWEKLKPRNQQNEIPPERYRHEIACYENQIYVLGGGTSQRVYTMNDMYVYSIEKNEWSLKDTKPDPISKAFPGSRRCHSCVQVDNAAYICGGYDGKEILGDLWKFDIKHLQWTKLADMPEPVYFHSAAVTSEGCMVVFGGVSCITTSARTDSCYEIWLKIPSLQTICWVALIKTRPALLKMSRSELLQLGINRYFANKLEPRAEGA